MTRSKITSWRVRNPSSGHSAKTQAHRRPSRRPPMAARPTLIAASHPSFSFQVGARLAASAERMAFTSSRLEIETDPEGGSPVLSVRFGSGGCCRSRWLSHSLEGCWRHCALLNCEALPPQTRDPDLHGLPPTGMFWRGRQLATPSTMSTRDLAALIRIGLIS